MKKVVRDEKEWFRAVIAEVLKRDGVSDREDAIGYATASWVHDPPMEFPCILVCFIVPCGREIHVCTEHVYGNEIKDL